MQRGVVLISILVGFAWPAPGSSVNQEFSDFTTPLPLKTGDTLILGIVGGWERWDAPQRGVRKAALQLREMKIPGVYVETVENHKLDLAMQLVDAAHTARVIIYGHSMGGMSAVRLARELDGRGVSVLALVLIDAIGHNHPISPNVREAANFFQRGSCPVCGVKSIRAEDASRTKVIGNFEWKYRGSNVDIHTEPWVRRFFVRDHEMMEFDPAMWAAVKEIIVKAARR